MFRRMVMMALLVLVPVAAGATIGPSGDYVYSMLVDTDNNSSTGCQVPVSETGFSGSVDGIEQIVKVYVTLAPTPTVSLISRQVCSGGTFGAETTVDPGGWAVALDDGYNESDAVEAWVSREDLGDPAVVRLVFTAESTVLPESDVLRLTDGNAGDPILLMLKAPAEPIPAATAPGVAVLLLLLGASALLILRRRTAPSGRIVMLVLALLFASAAVVLAASIVMDGDVSDWAGQQPAGIDQTGDSSIGDPAEDIVVAYATFDDDNIYFRVDLSNVEAPEEPTPTPTWTPTPLPEETPTPTPTPFEEY